MATDQNVFNHYFGMLTEAVSDNSLLHRPTQIYNCDEMGMPLGVTSHISCSKDYFQAMFYCITSNDKTQTAILACVNTA